MKSDWGITNFCCPFVSCRRNLFFMEYLFGRGSFALIVHISGSVACASCKTESAIMPSCMSLEFMINRSVMSFGVMVLASCIIFVSSSVGEISC